MRRWPSTRSRVLLICFALGLVALSSLIAPAPATARDLSETERRVVKDTFSELLTLPFATPETFPSRFDQMPYRLLPRSIAPAFGFDYRFSPHGYAVGRIAFAEGFDLLVTFLDESGDSFTDSAYDIHVLDTRSWTMRDSIRIGLERKRGDNASTLVQSAAAVVSPDRLVTVSILMRQESGPPWNPTVDWEETGTEVHTWDTDLQRFLNDL
ncbi:MAG: hypothetical protein EA403_01180 [Spirochaetaceae bacterium]|nr:MAG: hypothetical protein EA403_01180 [Spirochaetaceae bacterium]